MLGSRVTDAVYYHRYRGNLRGVVRAVRARRPEKFRWRHAVSDVSRTAGSLYGLDRLRLEEPVREMVLDLDDGFLQREVVLDARRYNVHLDRGEVLPLHTAGDLWRATFLIGTNMGAIRRFVRIPDDWHAPIDVPAVVLVARALSTYHRRRAQQMLLHLPEPGLGAGLSLDQRRLGAKAEQQAEQATRWTALSKTLLNEQPS